MIGPRQALLMLLVAGAFAPNLVAHGGEDHGAPAAPTVRDPNLGAVEAQSDAYEGLLRFRAMPASEPTPLDLFVSDYATNAPVTGADVSLRLSELGIDVPLAPSKTVAGLYEGVVIPGRTGTFAAVATVATKETTELLLFDGLRLGAAAATPAEPGGRRWGRLSWVGAVALAIIAAFLLGRRSARRGASAAVLLFVAARAQAHGGEDHGAGPATNASATVAIVAKEAQVTFGIRTVLAEPASLPGRRSWSGTVIARPDGRAEVIAPQAGRVAPVGSAVPRVGDVVRKGQPLLALDGSLTPNELLAVQTMRVEAVSRRTAASQELTLAEQQVARYEAAPDVVTRRDREEAVARLEMARAADTAAQRALDVLNASTASVGVSSVRYVLTAPIDGVITAGGATIGEAVPAGREFFAILDARRLWARVDVPERDVGGIPREPGTIARVLVPAAPALNMDVRFVSASHTVDPSTRTVPAFFEADVPSGQLLEGQLVQVQVDTGSATTGFVLPASAIVEIGGRTIAFAHVHAEEFSPRDVTLGTIDGDQVEVLAGLHEGDRIVVAGSAQVRAALLAGH